MSRLTRREFLGTMALAAAQSGVRTPNVIFILADDLGYGDLGCYGQRRIRTPNIDAMATGGLRFTSAYAGCAVCAPSRGTLMTGYHTGHGRVRGNDKTSLAADDFTLAEMFHSAGYRTGMFGKWGLGNPGTSGVPNAKGFDEFYGYLDQTHAHSYYSPHIWHNNEEMNVSQNMGTSHKFFMPDEFTKRALEFMAMSPGKPFFLYLPTTIPHADNELGRDTGNGMPVPSLGEYAQEAWPEVERGFAAQVSRLDADVGRVLARVKQLGIEDNTLVIFASDNGAHSEGGHSAQFFNSSGPLRGIKRDLYEGGIRIPMIARWPGHVASGTTTDRPIAFWDFLPTLAALIGATPPAGIDGASFVPTLERRAQPEHRPFYWEFHEGGFSQAVRVGDWKLVHQAPKYETELFNLRDDIGEKTNLAAKYPERVAQMQMLFKAERVDSPNYPVEKH